MSNKPKHDGLSQLRDTIRETFTMDEQCRMEFGEGYVSYANFRCSFLSDRRFDNEFSIEFSYEHCKTFDVAEPCSRLWCGNSNVSESCKTKKGPPLEGTLCGDSKVNRQQVV